MVVTADALHTQRDHASFLVDRGADYLLVVKANQPALHAQLAGWLRGHWRIENRLHWVRDVTFSEDPPTRAPAASSG